MQQALQKLKANKLLEALSYFEKHKPFDESAKILINYAQSQEQRVKEYIYKWILNYSQSPNIKIDVYNLLGCITQEPNKQIDLFNEALKLTVAFDLNPSTTLINLSCAYSKLKLHDKALQTALQSIECSMGKQLVLAYHNTAVEYKALKQEVLSLQYHQKAYQYCLQQFGDEDILTKKMEKYIFNSSIKKVPVSTQFRLRSQTRHSENQKSFYYKRQAQRNNSNSQSLQQVNKTICFTKQTDENDIYESIIQNNFDSKQLEEQIESQRQIRLKFLFSIHQQNIWQLERRKTNRGSLHINLSQDSIQNIDNQLSKSQEFIIFENQNPDGKYDSMIPINVPQDDLTQDDQELIIKQIQGFDQQNNNNTGWSFANQETFENTFEYKNKHNRAIIKIQKWYKKQYQINQIKKLSINLQHQQKVALTIQKNLKKVKQQQMTKYYKIKQQKQKIFQIIRQFQYDSKIKKYFRIIGIYQDQGITYKFIEVVNKQKKKTQLKFEQYYTYNEIRQKYQNFDDFFIETKMSKDIIQIAKQQKVHQNYQEICQLFYFKNKQLQLYGVTDYQFQLDIEDNDEIEQPIIEYRKPRMKLSSILKLQSLLKSYLAKTRSELLKRQIYKSKRFIEQISNEYYMIIMKEENYLQFYNVKTKRYCENEILVPQCVMIFYGAITRKNCNEIFQIQQNKVMFSEDAQYLIDKDQRSKQKIDQQVIERAVIKLQKIVRQKIIYFNEKIIKHKSRAQKAKNKVILFTLRKTYIYNNQYQIILTAYGETIQNIQWLVIKGGIISQEFQIPSIQPSCQRLFQNLNETDFLQVGKIILEELQFTQNQHKIQLICNSVEEVYGFLLQREYNKFKDCVKDAEHNDPTLQGRNFLSREIFTKHYLYNNRFEIQDRPQDINYTYDPTTSSLIYIKNTFIEAIYKKYQKIKENTIINSINHYVNSYPSINNYEWIADPEEIYQQKLQQSVKILQKSFRLLKFRIAIHQRCEIRRKRKAAQIEAQKAKIQIYYYDEIQIVQPFTTPQILERRGEVGVVLQIVEIENETYEWLLVLPYNDVVVTVYSQPRKFYQIKYLEYTNHYIEIILSGPVDKIQSYFRHAIEQFHPSEKYDFIKELREQFSRKVVRIVRLKLFFKKLKEIPVTKKFLIRTFINEFYVRINYFYNKSEQKIIIFLQKDNHKRKYEIELFYLDCLYGNYHQQKYLDKEDFIKLLTLNAPKGYVQYKKLLLPLVSVFHSYSTINFELEINYTYNDYEFPLQENVFEKYRTTSQACNLSWTESVQRFLPSIVTLQSKWRLYSQKKRYQYMVQKQIRMKIKLLSKRGVIIGKTYLKRKDISDDSTSNIFYLCNIYQSIDNQIINIRVELYSYKGQQQQELFNIFQIQPRQTLMNETIRQYILKNIFIENNNIILKQKYQSKFDIQQQQQQQQSPLKLLIKKPNSPKLIFHQNRQYSQGKFVYDAVHTGEAPLNNKQLDKNTIQINIDLKEIKTQYPGLNYKNKNSLPQLTEQIISGLKIDKQHVLSKQIFRKNGIKINGNCQLSEEDQQQIIKSDSKQKNTLLLRFTQFYKNIRYMVMISQLDIPINTYDKLDAIYEPYHSFIQVLANQQITNKKIIWQMNFQQAIEITNQQNANDIAKIIQQNILVLDNKFVFIVDHKSIDFNNVIMLKRHSIVLIQNMLKNRKFKCFRKQFEQEIKQLKESENQFWNNIVYYGINQFKSDDYFISLIIERKQYILLAWNIRNYQRYTLTIFKTKGYHEQLEKIRFINENLVL